MKNKASHFHLCSDHCGKVMKKVNKQKPINYPLMYVYQSTQMSAFFTFVQFRILMLLHFDTFHQIDFFFDFNLL